MSRFLSTESSPESNLADDLRDVNGTLHRLSHNSDSRTIDALLV